MPDETSFISARPYMAVRDVSRAVAFYRDILGLDLRVVYGDPPNFAILGRGGAAISLQLDGQGSLAGKTTCYVVVEGVAAVYERCRAGGAELDSDLAERPYGMRDFAVHDPDGNHVIVGESTRQAVL
jgi:catechol 2,3-dioxygenase-like lactoylglutathione lyase family enzyme